MSTEPTNESTQTAPATGAKKGSPIMKIVLIVAILAAIGTGLFVASIGKVIKTGITTAGPAVLGTPVTLKDVTVSVFSGKGGLKSLVIGNPEGFKTDCAFELDDVRIAVDIASLTSDTIHINEIYVDGPKITYEGALGRSNISTILKNIEAFVGADENSGEDKKGDEKKTDEKTASKKIIIDSFILKNAKVSLSMKIFQGQKISLPLPTIEMKDIGKESDTSTADAIKQVFVQINKAIIPAVTKAVKDNGKKILLDAPKAGLNKIKSLFKK